MVITQYWKELLSILILVAIISIEPAYREPAYDYSHQFISRWQKGSTNASINFFKFISLFGDQTLQVVVIVSVYCFATRRFFLKLILVVFVAQNLITYLKLIYHDPRPYFTSDNVTAMSCSRGYGNPSGHCLITASVYGALWFLLFIRNDKKQHTLFPKKWMLISCKWLSFSLILLLIILTFFSRLYLGVHSLNQTIYGTLLGLWVVYTFGFVLIPYLDNHYEEFITNGSIIKKINNKFLSCNAGFVLVIVISVGLQILNLSLYFSMSDQEEFMQEDWIRRMKDKCPEIKSTPGQNSFKGTLHAFLYALIYFAELFNARKFPKAFNYWYSNIGFKKLLLRTLGIVCILGICYIPYLVTTKASFTIKMTIGIVLSNILIASLGIPLANWLTEKFCFIQEHLEVNINIEGTDLRQV